MPPRRETLGRCWTRSVPEVGVPSGCPKKGRHGSKIGTVFETVLFTVLPARFRSGCEAYGQLPFNVVLIAALSCSLTCCGVAPFSSRFCASATICSRVLRCCCVSLL